MMNEDLVNSLTLLREALRSTIMIQEGLIRSIEKIQSQLIHSYELVPRPCQIQSDYSPDPSFQKVVTD
jgi:hypothetical protein